MERCATRLAFVLDTILPWHKGGRENRMDAISRRLATRGLGVHIYTMKWWDEPQKTIVRDGVTFHAICNLYPLYKNGRRAILPALIFGLATFKLLFERFDVIDVDHMPFYPLFSARIVCWLRGKKLNATWHEVWGKSYWLEYMKGPLGFFGFITEWLAFRLPDTIISNSEYTTERLRAAGVRAEIVTIPLGVDVEVIQSVTPSAHKSDVIFVGRLLSHKNVPLLLDAIVLVKKARPSVFLTIIGDGPERGNIKALISEKGLQDNVDLRGGTDSDVEKYARLRSSGVFVLPSEREGFGTVVIEANAAGVPVITVNCPNNAAKDLIEKGVNGVVAELTAEDIAKNIIYVLENRDSFNPARTISMYNWGGCDEAL